MPRRWRGRSAARGDRPSAPGRLTSGGLVVEGGRPREGDECGPLLARLPFPPRWRCVVAVPDARAGISGMTEEAAFAQLPAPPEREVERVAHLVLMALLPALADADLRGLRRRRSPQIQQVTGRWFAAVQGSTFAPGRSEELVRRMTGWGATGVGQSSWGPTVYGIVDGEAAAKTLADKVRADARIGAGRCTKGRSAPKARGSGAAPGRPAEHNGRRCIQVARFLSNLLDFGAVTILAKTTSAMVLIAVSTLVSSTVAGQAQPARGQATPAPPAPQPKHGSGALIVAGDVVNFNAAGTPNACGLQSRFKRGDRVGFRMSARDGGTGEPENTATVVAHVTFAGKTVDVPMRWRGVGGYPEKDYLRPPNDMWTGAWPVPKDAPIGTISYTVTATDKFGRKATFMPFAAIPSQLTIIE